jgi:hypothetical protein
MFWESNAPSVISALSRTSFQWIPSGETNPNNPSDPVPPSALNRSVAGVPGRASRNGAKLCVTVFGSTRMTLFWRVPLTVCSPRLGRLQ